MPSSRTMSIGISIITANPSTLVTSASVPGIKIVAKECLAAVRLSAPLMTSCSHDLVICTACETPIENIRNGTRIDKGSIPKPMIGSVPNSHRTGIIATTSATRVNFRSFTNHNISTAVIANAIRKNMITPRAPLEISPTALAKPIM